MKKMSPEVSSVLPTTTGSDAVPTTCKLACPSMLSCEVPALSWLVDWTAICNFKLSAKLWPVGGELVPVNCDMKVDMSKSCVNDNASTKTRPCNNDAC